MDIKKQFAYVLTDKAVSRFFRELQEEYSVFGGFEDFTEFVQFMRIPSHLSVPKQNQCLLSIISKIQSTKEQEDGLSILTYLLSPGLQKMLYRNMIAGEKAPAKFQSLWWHFFQSINKYPISNRPQRVAQNLLFDTLRGFLQEQRQERRWQNMESTDSNTIQEILSEEKPLHLDDIRAFMQGEDNAGLTEMDRDIVTSSRVYDESMHEIAERWGLENSTAYQRRYRAEKRLNKRWGEEK